jgi:hypothetical protein
MKEIELKPCKIHGTLPKFRERRELVEPFINRGLYPNNEYTIKEYYCPECENDRDIMNKNQIIQNWNDKQEAK